MPRSQRPHVSAQSDGRVPAASSTPCSCGSSCRESSQTSCGCAEYEGVRRRSTPCGSDAAPSRSCDEVSARLSERCPHARTQTREEGRHAEVWPKGAGIAGAISMSRARSSGVRVPPCNSRLALLQLDLHAHDIVGARLAHGHGRRPSGSDSPLGERSRGHEGRRARDAAEQHKEEGAHEVGRGSRAWKELLVRSPAPCW